MKNLVRFSLICAAIFAGLVIVSPVKFAQSTPQYVRQLPAGINTAGTLQAFVNAVPSAGGTLRLPGNYSETVTSAVSISTANVHILCDGGAQLISSGAAQLLNFSGTGDELGYCTLSGATQQAIWIAAASVYVHHNSITNGGNTVPGAGTNAGIEIEGTNNDVRVEYNTITGGGACGTPNTGGDIVVNFGSNTTNNGTPRLHFIGNHIFGNCSPFNIFTFNVTDTEYRANVIDGNNKIGSSNTASGYGIMAYNTAATTGPCKNLVVTENNVQNTAGTGIYLQGCLYSVVAHNVLINTAQQQLDSVLTVGAIACNAGNPPSPTAPGVVIDSNTIHTSGKQGIEISHCPGVVISNNTMDGISKYGVEVVSGSDQNPMIAHNSITTATGGIIIFGTGGAMIKGNFITGCGASPCVFTDTSSPNAQAEGNNITANSADSQAMWIQGNSSLVASNNFYGLVTVTTGEVALRITGTGSAVRNNFFANTSIQNEILNTACSACIFESNTFLHTTGTSFAIVEQAAAANNIYRRNLVSGGTSPGWSLGGTTPTEYENSFNGSIDAMLVTSLKIGANTILPATLTGTQGIGVKLATATGAFTNGNLRGSDTNGTEIDGGIVANTLVTKMVSCGTTTTCSASTLSAPHALFGSVALTAGSAVVTGIPAWTSTSTFVCTCQDASARNACGIANTSTTSITVSGTGTDTIGYQCSGN